MNRYLSLLLLLPTFAAKVQSDNCATGALIPPDNVDCPRGNQRLSFSCIAYGTQPVIWGGTVFDCKSGSRTLVLHPGDTEEKHCGQISARVTASETGRFVSSVSFIPVSANSHGTVACHQAPEGEGRNCLIGEVKLGNFSRQMSIPTAPALDVSYPREKSVLLSWEDCGQFDIMPGGGCSDWACDILPGRQGLCYAQPGEDELEPGCTFSLGIPGTNVSGPALTLSSLAGLPTPELPGDLPGLPAALLPLFKFKSTPVTTAAPVEVPVEPCPRNETRVENRITLQVSGNLSCQYPADDPLIVSLGDILNLNQTIPGHQDIFIFNTQNQTAWCGCEDRMSGVDSVCSCDDPGTLCTYGGFGVAAGFQFMVTLTENNNPLNNAVAFRGNRSYFLAFYDGDRSRGGCDLFDELAMYICPLGTRSCQFPPVIQPSTTTEGAGDSSLLSGTSGTLGSQGTPGINNRNVATAAVPVPFFAAMLVSAIAVLAGAF